MDAPLPPCGPSQSQEPLDKQAASRLAGAFSTVHLRQGEAVAAEGATVDRCFLIEYGSVEVRKQTAPGAFCTFSTFLLRSCSAEHGKSIRQSVVNRLNAKRSLYQLPARKDARAGIWFKRYRLTVATGTLIVARAIAGTGSDVSPAGR